MHNAASHVLRPNLLRHVNQSPALLPTRRHTVTASAGFLRPPLGVLAHRSSTGVSGGICRAGSNNDAGSVPQDGPGSPQAPKPVAAWDRTRGLGWLSFIAIWIVGVGLAIAMPQLLQRLSEMTPMAVCGAVKTTVLMNMEMLMERVARFHLIAKILFVLAAGTPLVLSFGAAYRLLTGAAWDASLQKFYLLIFRMPGMNVTSDKTLSALLLVNFAYYIGLFTFAIFLGVVTEEVKNTFKSIKGGMLPVRETGHIVLLNWNKYTPLVLQAIAAAKKSDPSNAFFQRPVSVLAEKPKAEMDAAVKNLGLNIHVRVGNPNLGKDLLKVAADKATTVLVMQPEGTADPGDVALGFNARAKVAATAMTVSSMFGAGGPDQRLVLHEARSEHAGSFLDSVKRTCPDLIDNKDGGLQVALLGRNELAQRFLALSSIQPGICKIYSEILSPEGATLHSMALPEALDGATYVQVRRSFSEAVVCGYLRNGVVNLLPSETDVLRAQDTLVYLSRSSRPPAWSEATRAVFEACDVRSTEGKHSKRVPRKIIVVAMSARPVADLTKDFAQFSVPGTVVTFVLPVASQKAAQAVTLPQGPCKFNLQFVQDNNPSSTMALSEAGIKDADTVVIGGIASSELPADQVDHCTMAILLQIQDAVRASGRTSSPHVVARVRSSAAAAAISDFFATYKKAVPPADVCKVIKRPELLQVEQLIGAVLAQSASSRFYLPIMQHLLSSSSGAEVYMRDPASYGLSTAEPVTFADITEHARLYDETAIGFVSDDGKATLALEPTAKVSLKSGYRIVSLAADHILTKSKRV